MLIVALFFSVISATAEEAAPTAVADKGVARQFEIKLDIANGHIGHVYIGCHESATDGYDMRIDDMAPPAGMGGIGYTFLVSPDREHNLYRDIRAYADTVRWVFYAKPGRKPVEVSWDAVAIPDGWDLFCGSWDGKSEAVSSRIDCRQTTRVSTDTVSFFQFWIVRQNAE